MNKLTKIGCLLLSLTMTSSILASCGGGKGKKQTYNTETRPLIFSTDALDGTFNPFFATSATDSTIAAITQVGMLTTDANGNPKCGDDVPTVALAYKETFYDANNVVTTDPVKATKANGGSTVYEFLIKEDMKFSDGEDLDIQDVLFNLYVYLDPAYMGSATIYSTDIKGLKAYRNQDPDMDDSAEVNDAQFSATAQLRLDNLARYLDGDLASSDEIQKDMALAKKIYREYLESTWTACSGAYESYQNEYFFTEDEAWAYFYVNVGIVGYQMYDGAPVRVPSTNNKGEAVEKYLTDLDAPKDNPTAEPDGQHHKEAILEVRAGENPEYPLQTYIDDQGCTEAEAGEYAVRDFAIDTAFAETELNSSLYDIVNYVVYYDLFDRLIIEAKSDWAADLKDQNEGKLVVDTISGITTYKTNNFYGKKLSKQHDVLKIEINGVDPKAIWNFAFSVAPMHYYSEDFDEFTPLSSAEADKGTSTNCWGVANQYVNFGVEFNNEKFFNEILRNDEKSGLPVGAGVYKASNAPGTSGVSRKTFYRNKIVYYERNEYFDTMGGKNVFNAKIKYMRYVEVGSNNIINQLRNEYIDFGAPQATKDNIDIIETISHLKYRRYRTNGYGYIGINPKFVPDIEVRRAIMHAMNTVSIVDQYYKTPDLAEPVFRSMSKESWAYPREVTGPYYELTRFKQDIIDLVNQAGWFPGSDGILAKDGKKLNLTFTIAGDSTDHPAYLMFQDAEEFLESCGFKITIVTDPNALKNLATGNLAVWAAAWNSTIDPDLYQVYHKDSNATSIKNWGYETIKENADGGFDEEIEIIDALSDLIEQGRETTLRDGINGRKAIYAQALDKIMELAVELPTYQRCDLVVYNSKVIDNKTLNEAPTANAGVYDELWKVNYL